jgi:hypothetical protein
MASNSFRGEIVSARLQAEEKKAEQEEEQDECPHPYHYLGS